MGLKGPIGIWARHIAFHKENSPLSELYSQTGPMAENFDKVTASKIQPCHPADDLNP